jgi:hypothetical protein
MSLRKSPANSNLSRADCRRRFAIIAALVCSSQTPNAFA